jgi:ABC-type Zn2+ transport system substrate-binding protein/surface adhesin
VDEEEGRLSTPPIKRSPLVLTQIVSFLHRIVFPHQSQSQDGREESGEHHQQDFHHDCHDHDHDRDHNHHDQARLTMKIKRKEKKEKKELKEKGAKEESKEKKESEESEEEYEDKVQKVNQELEELQLSPHLPPHSPFPFPFLSPFLLSVLSLLLLSGASPLCSQATLSP